MKAAKTQSIIHGLPIAHAPSDRDDSSEVRHHPEDERRNRCPAFDATPYRLAQSKDLRPAFLSPLMTSRDSHDPSEARLWGLILVPVRKTALGERFAVQAASKA